MKGSQMRKIGLTGIVATVLLSAAGANAPSDNFAAVENNMPDSGSSETVFAEEVADRIMFKMDQTFFKERAKSFAESTSTADDDISADEYPEPGEIVVIKYADATVMHQSISGGCTLTTSAGNPYKKGGNTVNATTKYKQSACSNVERADGALQMYWGFE